MWSRFWGQLYAKWLRDPDLKRKFLDALRGAEVAASRRLTYRDLLGHISLAILGQPEQSWLKNQHPCNWVEQKVREPNNSNIAELVTHRVYNNLFPLTDTFAWQRATVKPRQGNNLYGVLFKHITSVNESARAHAFERAFNDIDPARDFEPWNGIREKVIEAVEALDIMPPSQSLTNENIVPTEAHSDLESLLDQILQEEIAEELSNNPNKSSSAAIQRTNLLRKWRNTLLLRQVGLASGQIAFKNAIAAWLIDQQNALNERDTLDLGKGLEALVLPTKSSREFLLAPLRPRTYTMSTKQLLSNTLYVSLPLNDLKVDIIPKGDILTAEVLQVTRYGKPKTIASLVIDLAIAREAILRVHENLDSFTEIGDAAFARIERVRASLVSRERLKNTTVYFTDETGSRFRIINNPAGPAPLQIIAVE